MIKTFVWIILVSSLGGCGLAYKISPSYEYCQELSYVRKGIDVDIVAKCKAPLGD